MEGKKISVVVPAGLYDQLTELANMQKSRPSTLATFLLSKGITQLWTIHLMDQIASLMEEVRSDVDGDYPVGKEPARN